MLCPVCRVEMILLELYRVELDYCPQCAGVWLDSGELELIGERAGALQPLLLRALEEKKAEPRGDRRCPVCRRAMESLETNGEASIVLNRCPSKHGLWFDRGELEAVVKAVGADKGNLLAQFFGELERPKKNPNTE